MPWRNAFVVLTVEMVGRGGAGEPDASFGSGSAPAADAGEEGSRIELPSCRINVLDATWR